MLLYVCVVWRAVNGLASVRGDGSKLDYISVCTTGVDIGASDGVPAITRCCRRLSYVSKANVCMHMFVLALLGCDGPRLYQNSCCVVLHPLGSDCVRKRV